MEYSTMDNQELEQVIRWVRSRFFGKYRGLVSDNQDPTDRGRIKVRVPSVLQDQEVWAMPCVPFAGDDLGTYLIPEPGAGVWVEFEGGDPSFAIWTGGYWADGQLPSSETGASATASRRTIKSEKGLMISFDDDSEKLTISDKDGTNIMTFEVQSGKVRVEAGLKVVIEAPQIELVENSSHPLVFGDNLLQYLNQLVQIFNTHMHPGELAAGMLPVTPMTPVSLMPAATPSLLSTRVTTG